MTIPVDQSKLLKGNIDITDEGHAQLQSELQRQRDETQLMRWFPELFRNLENTPSRTTP